MTTFFDTFDQSQNYYVTPLLAPRPPVIPPNAQLANDTKYYEKFYFTFTYSSVSFLISFILFILWVIGINTLIILGILQTQRKLMSDIYVANITLTDVLLGLLVLPFMCIVVLLGYFPFNQTVCSVWIYFDYYLIITSAFMFPALLWNYSYMIYSPDRYKNIDSKTHITIIVIIVVIVHFLWGPPFFYDRSQSASDAPGICGYSIGESQNKYFTLYIGIFGLYLPAVLAIGLAIWSGHAVYISKKRIFFADIVPQGHRQPTMFLVKVLPIEKQIDLQTDYMEIASTHLPSTLCILCVFLATRLAFYIYFGAGAFIPKFLPPDLSDSVYWLMHSNAAISPILHIILDSELRRGIQIVLQRLLRLKTFPVPVRVASSALLIQ